MLGGSGCKSFSLAPMEMLSMWISSLQANLAVLWTDGFPFSAENGIMLKMGLCWNKQPWHGNYSCSLLCCVTEEMSHGSFPCSLGGRACVMISDFFLTFLLLVFSKLCEGFVLTEGRCVRPRQGACLPSNTSHCIANASFSWERDRAIWVLWESLELCESIA